MKRLFLLLLLLFIPFFFSFPSSEVVPFGVQRLGVKGAPLNTFTDVDVAVFDTGINPHSDLYVRGGVDCTGRDVTALKKGEETPEPPWKDDIGHGTHVAGIIGALSNGKGVQGVAPGARLWAVKVLVNGYGTPWTVLCGLDWLLERKGEIEVANFSISIPLCPHPPVMGGEVSLKAYEECEKAYLKILEKLDLLQDSGMILIFAAGNDARNTRYGFPWLEIPGIVSVGAIADYDGEKGGKGTLPLDECAGPFGYFNEWGLDGDDTYASYSNYGRFTDILAPGTCILSTFLENGYALHTGTSMAAPHVTGLAALWKVKNPAGFSWEFEIELRGRAEEELRGEGVAKT